jgi:pyruvate/2-oxoglutarate dehydrogenase complex dihydrolipoamide dehydrogenase (E3) component
MIKLLFQDGNIKCQGKVIRTNTQNKDSKEISSACYCNPEVKRSGLSYIQAEHGTQILKSVLSRQNS